MIFRQVPINAVFVTFLTAPLVPISPAAEEDFPSPGRPNILFFLSDDQRADFLGCAGHPVLKTPVLDGLAARGVRFENAFVTTSICAASRATILTGTFERTHGYTFGKPPVSRKLTGTSYPAVLKDKGYRTGFVGKYGIADYPWAKKEMFDSFVPLNRAPYFKKMPDGTERHVTEIAGDKAIEFIEDCEEGQPFCLSVSFNASHAEDGDKRPGIGHFPWPKAEDGLYDDVEIPLPRHSDPKVFEAHPEFMRESMNRDRFFWRWDTPEKYQTNVRAYYRMITGFDRVIGRVLEALEEKGLAENTVVIFMGDNGYYKGARGFAGKWSHFEESLRVPLIICDPRVPKGKQGRVEEEIALNLDIAPTILEFAGLEKPKYYQGKELASLVSGKQPEIWRKSFFCEHLMNNPRIHKWEGVRGERYVYARYFEQDPPFEYLHDLKDDPGQLKNYAGDGSKAKVLERMRAECDKLRDEYASAAPPVPTADQLMKEAMATMNEGDIDAVEEGTALLGMVIRQQPDNPRPRYIRGIAFDALGQDARAVADFGKALELGAENQSEIYFRRGVSRFMAGNAKGSVADFDKYLEAHPDRGEPAVKREAALWQRGLAHYYAKMFQKGREQFELHKTVNGNDVENALWHFLCVAQLEGPEAAEKAFLETGHDRRVPMMELWDLYAGKATKEEVLAAAKAGDPSAEELRNRLCYTHLYLGLYAEALGKKAEAEKHMKLSAVDYAMPHYMGKVSRVHRKVRGNKP